MITDEGREQVLKLVEAAAQEHLKQIDDRRVWAADPEGLLARFEGALPEAGTGAERAIRQLIDDGLPVATNSIGPRFFHFVVGGVTPAALAADWFTSLVDQMSYAWAGSPLASRLEQISIRWLIDLFGLPARWGGVLTTGATTGNMVCLAGARQWWGEQEGIDIGEEGLLRQPPVLAGGYLHPSAYKALAILGVGRARIEARGQRYGAPRTCPPSSEPCRRSAASPSIVIATAGDPNAGGFDPIEPMAELARRYNAWLHIDGAFGMFAACAPDLAHLVRGAGGARSVSVDLHKWMNVPYDSGAAFIHDLRYLARAFHHQADYLPDADDPHPNFGFLVPEMSRRARAFPVLGDLAGVRPAGHPRARRGHGGPGRAARGAGGGGAGSRAPRAAPAQRRVLPLSPAGARRRDPARRAEHAHPRAGDRGRPRVLRRHALRGPRGVSGRPWSTGAPARRTSISRSR